MSVSSKDLLVSIASLSWMDVNHLISIHICHHGLVFSNLVLFWVLSDRIRVYFTVGPSSSPCRSFFILLSIRVFRYDITVFIFCSIVPSAPTTIGITVAFMVHIIMIIISPFASFSLQRQLMVVRWSLSDIRSPGLFSVFWTNLTMLQSGWSRVFWFSLLLDPFPNLWGPFQVHQLQLVSPSPSCYTAYLLRVFVYYFAFFLCFAGTTYSSRRQVLFFLLIISRFGFLAGI